MLITSDAKNDLGFQKLLQDYAQLDEETGVVSFKPGLYVSLGVNVSWKGKTAVLAYAHLVWFLKHGRWPKQGFVIDHINDCALDNRPVNHQEITAEENQLKRRGRTVNRNYGSGKYGFGFILSYDKRDGYYYLSRNLSRGHGKGDLKRINRSFGRFETLELAEAKIKDYISEINEKGLDHMPFYDGKKAKKRSIELMVETQKMRRLRRKGWTIRKIAEVMGFSSASVYKRVRDVVKQHRVRPTLLEP